MAQLASNKICLAALASSKGGNLEGELLTFLFAGDDGIFIGHLLAISLAWL